MIIVMKVVSQSISIRSRIGYNLWTALWRVLLMFHLDLWRVLEMMLVHRMIIHRLLMIIVISRWNFYCNYSFNGTIICDMVLSWASWWTIEIEIQVAIVLSMVMKIIEIKAGNTPISLRLKLSVGMSRRVGVMAMELHWRHRHQFN